MRGGFLHHGPQMADALCSSHGVVDRLLCCTPPLFEVRRFVGQPAQAGMAVGHYCSERLVDFMGYRGSKFPARRHTSDVPEFHPSQMSLFFNSSCLRDVHNGANEIDIRSTFNRVGDNMDVLD